MFRKWLFFAPVAVIVVLTSQGHLDAQPQVRHPRLHAALFELSKAHQELKDSGAGFGGHRKVALKAIEDAIQSVRTILQVKGDNPNVVLRKPDFYRAYKNYPHLRQVLLDLKEARNELQDAKADFGANRQRAIQDLNLAIKQVKLAVDNID